MVYSSGSTIKQCVYTNLRCDEAIPIIVPSCQAQTLNKYQAGIWNEITGYFAGLFKRDSKESMDSSQDVHDGRGIGGRGRTTACFSCDLLFIHRKKSRVKTPQNIE